MRPVRHLYAVRVRAVGAWVSHAHGFDPISHNQKFPGPSGSPMWYLRIQLGLKGTHTERVFLQRQWWLLRRADGTSSTTAPSAAARCTHASASRFDRFFRMIMPTHRPIRLLVRPHRSWMFNVGTANGGASPNGCSFSKTVCWNLAMRPERLLNCLDEAPPA